MHRSFKSLEFLGLGSPSLEQILEQTNERTLERKLFVPNRSTLCCGMASGHANRSVVENVPYSVLTTLYRLDRGIHIMYLFPMLRQVNRPS